MTVSASDHRLPDWSVGFNVEPAVMSIRNTHTEYAYFAPSPPAHRLLVPVELPHGVGGGDEALLGRDVDHRHGIGEGGGLDHHPRHWRNLPPPTALGGAPMKVWIFRACLKLHERWISFGRVSMSLVAHLDPTLLDAPTSFPVFDKSDVFDSSMTQRWNSTRCDGGLGSRLMHK